MHEDLVKEPKNEEPNSDPSNGGYKCDKHGTTGVDPVLHISIGSVEASYCLLCLNDLLSKHLTNLLEN